MKKPVLIGVGVVLAALVISLFDALFTVRENEQAIVLQFGDPKRVIRDAGLNVKIPFIQNVVVYEKRLLPLDPPAEQVILSDQKRLDVDSITRFRIVDPLAFYQAFRIESAARDALRQTVNGSLRRVLGQVTLLTLLSDERDAVMREIRDEVHSRFVAYGIEVVDVRIRRADLPDATSQAIYARMQSEREREAREFRAQGEELARQIRSRAEREQVVIVAEARRQADQLRGEGEAEATRIYGEATSRDPEFYAFYRSLESYRTTLANPETTMVLTPHGEFFRFFQTIPGVGEPFTGVAAR